MCCVPLCNDDSVLQQQQEQLEQDIDFIMSMVMIMRSPLYMLALLILCNMPGYMYVRYLCKCVLQCTHTVCVCVFVSVFSLRTFALTSRHFRLAI